MKKLVFVHPAPNELSRVRVKTDNGCTPIQADRPLKGGFRFSVGWKIPNGPILEVRGLVSILLTRMEVKGRGVGEKGQRRPNRSTEALVRFKISLLWSFVSESTAGNG